MLSAVTLAQVPIAPSGVPPSPIASAISWKAILYVGYKLEPAILAVRFLVVAKYPVKFTNATFAICMREVPAYEPLSPLFSEIDGPAAAP
jgi:hypothetical protein